jgi:hypothetical protein
MSRGRSCLAVAKRGIVLDPYSDLPRSGSDERTIVTILPHVVGGWEPSRASGDRGEVTLKPPSMCCNCLYKGMQYCEVKPFSADSFTPKRPPMSRPQPRAAQAAIARVALRSSAATPRVVGPSATAARRARSANRKRAPLLRQQSI